MKSVPAVRERLLRENWDLLLQRARDLARKEVGCRCWRGRKGGVLPCGYDISGVAAEAVAELFNGECQLPDAAYTDKELTNEIKRLVHNLVRRLHRRKETRLVVSEWDVLRPDEEGVPRSVFSGLADPSGDEQARLATLEGLKAEFERFLRDPQLIEVFRCVCAGVRSAEGIAAKVGVGRL